MWWLLKEPLVFLLSPATEQVVQKLGPLIYKQALRSCLAFLSPLQYSSHRLNILACCFLYFLRCTRFSFFSDTSRMWRDVSRASRWSRSIRRYRGSWDLLEARRWSPWCQPSTSLFVRTDCRKTVQVDGSQVLPSIQVDRTYWMNCLRFPSSVTCDSKCSNCGTILSSGRNGNAITRRMKSWVPRSFL